MTVVNVVPELDFLAPNPSPSLTSYVTLGKLCDISASVPQSEDSEMLVLTAPNGYHEGIK